MTLHPYLNTKWVFLFQELIWEQAAQLSSVLGLSLWEGHEQRRWAAFTFKEMFQALLLMRVWEGTSMGGVLSWKVNTETGAKPNKPQIFKLENKRKERIDSKSVLKVMLCSCIKL